MNNWIAYYLLGPLEEKEATTGAILFCTGSLCDILARGFLEAEHKRKKKKKKEKRKNVQEKKNQSLELMQEEERRLQRMPHPILQ